jgi:oxygen-dependent protoporphyrinogen oxidase
MTIVSFKTGLSRLPERLGEVLGESLMLNAPVAGVERRDGRFAVSTESETFEAAELVLAVPADSAASFLRPHSARLADLLDGVEYPPLASVTLAYEDDDVTHPCNGFGFLAPRTAGLRTLGGLFPSSLFPGRAPEGWKSFTCFIGGATDPGAVELSDDELVAQVSGDLERAVGATGDPRVLSVTRWARAIPQYNLGHVARVAEIEREAAALGVRMLGNYLHGVSVGDCISAASK